MSLKGDMNKYRRLYYKASAGDIEALGKLSAFNDIMVKEINKELRMLERKGFDYGTAYNNATYFTEYEYGSKRFKTSKSLKNNAIDILTQMEQMVKFKSYKSSSVEGQQDILKNKSVSLKEQGIVPENISDRTMKSFIKFLGNEETRTIIDEYGESDKVIEMIFDAFKSRKNTIAGMKKAFTEYMGRRYTETPLGFDAMMRRIGINVFSNKYR